MKNKEIEVGDCVEVRGDAYCIHGEVVKITRANVYIKDRSNREHAIQRGLVKLCKDEKNN